MRILPYSPEALQEALTVIRGGGVVAHATETCYGLACDLSDKKAVIKLFAIKQRPESQPVSGLFASMPEAQQYAEWNEKAALLADAFLPGPLTIILPLRSDAPKKLYPCPSGGATIGVRVSSHPHAQDLVGTFGGPLSTTSANLHGQPNPYSADDIVRQFEKADHVPDLILDSGPLPPVPPSTVMDCTTETLQKKRSGDVHIGNDQV